MLIRLFSRRCATRKSTKKKSPTILTGIMLFVKKTLFLEFTHFPLFRFIKLHKEGNVNEKDLKNSKDLESFYLVCLIKRQTKI